jgi:hypothetical protein
LSITAEKCAFDLTRVRGLAVTFDVRQVPETQPSPVVSFSTACDVMMTVPANRGSPLADVPRQTAFVTRKVFPPSVHVRVCMRVWVALKAAETSAVCG